MNEPKRGVGASAGTVHQAGGGVYVVVLDDGTRVEASLRGRIKRERRTGDQVVIGDRVEVIGDRVEVVGDRVEVAGEGDHWTIETVLPRRTELVRRGRGGRTPKILAANLDRVFVVVSLRDPPASEHLIDRLLVLVESGGMRPTLVLNKLDLDGAARRKDEFRRVYEAAGYEVLAVSAERGTGVAPFHDALCSGTSALIGPSGVGKSSLLNAIDPHLDLKTAGLSKKTGGGRHTTVRSRLIPLGCGGLVADTPGFGDVGLWSVGADEIAGCFPEFEPYAETCRFRGCTHDVEPACAVREAVEAGEIAASRYESYRRLRAEAQASPRY